MTKSLKLIALGVLSTSLIACGDSTEKENKTTEKNTTEVANVVEGKKKKEVKKDTGLYAIVKTTKGDIKLGLQFERTPMTVANFVALANGTMKNDDKAEGVPFYDGLVFHRVMQNFMIQTGCPQGTGTGDPGYKFPDEIDTELKHNGSGVLSMANSGPATNGSQFFITHKETPWLDGKHTVFGYLLEGQAVVDSIKQGDMINTIEIVAKNKSAKKFVSNAASIFETAKVEAAKKAEEAAKKAEMEAKMAQENEIGDLEKFIKENYPKATKTESGLYYIVNKKGNGPQINTQSVATVNYTGKLLSGKMFDTSNPELAKENNIFNPQRNYAPIPVDMKRGGMIKGWMEALPLFKKGDFATIIMPSALAYGSRGGGPIKPFSTLLFEIEIVDVK